MSASNQVPIHDEDVAATSVLKVDVAIHQSELAKLKPDESGWCRPQGSDGVVVRLQLSPDAWRAIGTAFSRYPTEPEWRLRNAMQPDGTALSAWSECRASEPEMLTEGPGAFMHPETCMLVIEIKDFGAIHDVLKGGNE